MLGMGFPLILFSTAISEDGTQVFSDGWSSSNNKIIETNTVTSSDT